MPNKWCTAVDYCEIHGSRREEFGQASGEGHVQLECDYDKRFRLIKDIYLNDIPFVGVDKALLKTASISFPADRQTVTDGAFNPNTAIIQLTYSIHEKPEFFKETFEPQVEFQILEADNFHWGLNPAPPQGRQLKPKEAPGRQVRSYVYTVKWIHQESVPGDFFLLNGSTNNAAFTTDTFEQTFEPETMLFLNGSIEDSIYWGDTVNDDPPVPGFDYTCKFLIRKTGDPNEDKGWNHYFRSDSAEALDANKYERIYRKRESSAPVVFYNYPPFDLSDLLPEFT